MVLAIMVLIVGVSLPLYSYIQNSRVVDSSRQEVLEGLRTARNRALAGLNDSNQGVHFTPTECVIYEGSSYATRDSSYDFIIRLASGLSFSGLGEVNFEKKTGEPSVTGTINIIKVGGVTRALSINNQGYIY